MKKFWMLCGFCSSQRSLANIDNNRRVVRASNFEYTFDCGFVASLATSTASDCGLGHKCCHPGMDWKQKSCNFSIFYLYWIDFCLLRLPLSPMLPSVVPGLVSLLVSLIISSASHCFAYLECAMSRPPHRVPSPAPLTRSFQGAFCWRVLSAVYVCITKYPRINTTAQLPPRNEFDNGDLCINCLSVQIFCVN